MTPRFPDEVDVFSVPHSRMRDLVRMYKSQVSYLQTFDAECLCREELWGSSGSCFLIHFRTDSMIHNWIKGILNNSH